MEQLINRKETNLNSGEFDYKIINLANSKTQAETVIHDMKVVLKFADAPNSSAQDNILEALIGSYQSRIMTVENQ